MTFNGVKKPTCSGLNFVVYYGGLGGDQARGWVSLWDRIILPPSGGMIEFVSTTQECGSFIVHGGVRSHDGEWNRPQSRCKWRSLRMKNQHNSGPNGNNRLTGSVLTPSKTIVAPGNVLGGGYEMLLTLLLFDSDHEEYCCQVCKRRRRCLQHRSRVIGGSFGVR